MKQRTGRDHLILQPEAIIPKIEDSGLSRLTDILWEGEHCYFQGFDVRTDNPLLDVKVHVSTGHREPDPRRCVAAPRYHHRGQYASVALDRSHGLSGELNNPGCMICLSPRGKGCESYP